MTIAELMAQAQSRDDQARQLLAAAGAAPTDAQLDQIEMLSKEATELRSQADRLRRVDSLRQTVTAHQPRLTDTDKPVVEQMTNLIEKDPKAGFKHGGLFLQAVSGARPERNIMDARLKHLFRAGQPGVTIRNAAGSDEQGIYDPSYGGFALPEAMMAEYLTVSGDVDPSAGLTMQMTMQAPTVKINARVDRNHSTSVSGGLTISRRLETQEPTASRMQMEQVVFEATGLAGLAYATEELLRWSPMSFTTLLEQGFADEFASFEFNEKLRGTGAGEPEGIFNSPAAITISGESGQTADTIIYENILNMRKRAWRYGNCVWMANHDCLPELAKLKVDVGSGGQLVYQPSAREDLPDMLMGRPIYYTEYSSALGDTGDLCLVNWSQYIQGNLGGVEAAESIHVRFLNNERAFRFLKYNDGRCWWRSALTPKYGATKSPIVILGSTNR